MVEQPLCSVFSDWQGRVGRQASMERQREAVQRKEIRREGERVIEMIEKGRCNIVGADL